jgi:outer membrane protein assembly factor BamB
MKQNKLVTGAALRLGMLLLVLGGLMACGSNSAKDELTEPMELVDFEQQVELDKLWSRDVGSGQGNKFNRLQPAIDGDVIYVADADGDVLALDRISGKKIWSVDIDAEVTGGVGSAEGLVLLGTASGDVYALNAENGEQLWQVRVSGEVLAPPATDGDVVVVQTFNGKLYGLNSVNGDPMWDYSSQVPVLTLRGTAAPVIEGGRVFAGFANGKLVSADVDSGAIAWEGRVAMAQGESEIERVVDVDGQPLLLSNALFAVSYQGRIAGFDPASGRTLWYQDASSYVGLADGFGNVYYVDADGSVVAADQRTGNIRWSNEELGYRKLSAPATFNNYLAVADYDGYVHILSQIDGEFVARVKVGSGGVRAPVLSRGDIIYVYGNKGKLVAWQLRKSAEE